MAMTSHITKNTGELFAARSDPRSHLYSVDVLGKTAKVGGQSCSETRPRPILWLKRTLIPFWCGSQAKSCSWNKAKGGFRHVPPTFLACPATKRIVPRARRRQSGPARHDLKAETGRPVSARLKKKNKQTQKKKTKQKRHCNATGKTDRVTWWSVSCSRILLWGWPPGQTWGRSEDTWKLVKENTATEDIHVQPYTLFWTRSEFTTSFLLPCIWTFEFRSTV